MLAEFFTKNLDVVNFFQGLAFFTMGIAIFAQPRIVHADSVFKLSKIIWMLAGFGVIRGLLQWFYMIVTMRGHSSNAFDLIWALGLTLSYVFIFEFGRRLILLTFKEFLNIWSTIILSSLALILIFILKGERSIWPRYLLGFPGGIMSAFGLVFYYRNNENILEPFGIRRYFLMAVVSIGMWGVLSGAIPPKGGFFPPSVINETSFLNLIGIPVQVFRAFCAIFLTWAIWHILTIFDWELKAKLKNSEKLAAMGKFSSIIGHELRNQLGTLGISVYFLKMKLQDADEKVKRHLAILEQQVIEANRIIENILAFSRTRKPEFKSVDLEHILLNVIDKFQTLKEVLIDTQIEKDLPMIQGDEIQLARVFENIISNAIEAMDERGKLSIRTRRVNDSVNVIFEDTGRGIKKEDKEKMFEPFFSTKAHGVGLGLFICRNIIEAHGGNINIESELDKGTVVTITLPTKG